MKKITILGIGNILLSDEGLGIRALEHLKNNYNFPKNVKLIDGGVLGIKLVGVFSSSDIIIVLDAIKNNGTPGDIYVFNKNSILSRIKTKNSLHQVDFLETIKICELINKKPKIIMLGIEPKDITTLKPKLTDVVLKKINDFIKLILNELNKLNIKYYKKKNKIKISKYWKVP